MEKWGGLRNSETGKRSYGIASLKTKSVALLESRKENRSWKQKDPIQSLLSHVISGKSPSFGSPQFPHRVLLVLTLPFSGPRFPICTNSEGQFSVLSLLGLSIADTADHSVFLKTLASKILAPEMPFVLFLSLHGPLSWLLSNAGVPWGLLSPLTLFLSSFSPTALNTRQTQISTSYFCPELQTHMVN